MNFRFLYDPSRRLLAIGYRAADVEGPGGLDGSDYDLLASEARLASFLAIAKGTCRKSTGFAWDARSRACTGRRLCCRGSHDVRVSDAAAHHEDLSWDAARRVVPHGGAPPAGLRQGARRALGNLRMRLRPGRTATTLISTNPSAFRDSALNEAWADELVVAPYATALAALVEPAAAADNLRRLAAQGLAGEYGYFDAVDYTPREGGEPRTPTALRGGPCRRDRRDLHGPPSGDDADGARQRAWTAGGWWIASTPIPAVQATEILLQERALAPAR